MQGLILTGVTGVAGTLLSRWGAGKALHARSLSFHRLTALDHRHRRACAWHRPGGPAARAACLPR